MTLLKCTKNHLQQLQAIAKETFQETFSAHIAQADMQDYLATAFSKQTLLGELENDCCAFYLAQQNAEFIGYLKVNEAPAQTELNDPEALELQRIYLRKHKLGNGAGKYLLDYAIALAESKQKRYLWLGVWENNHRALNFYKKHGFYEFSEHFFITGNDRSRDLLMRKDLG